MYILQMNKYADLELYKISFCAGVLENVVKNPY